MSSDSRSPPGGSRWYFGCGIADERLIYAIRRLPRSWTYRPGSGPRGRPARLYAHGGGCPAGWPGRLAERRFGATVDVLTAGAIYLPDPRRTARQSRDGGLAAQAESASMTLLLMIAPPLNAVGRVPAAHKGRRCGDAGLVRRGPRTRRRGTPRKVLTGSRTSLLGVHHNGSKSGDSFPTPMSERNTPSVFGFTRRTTLHPGGLVRRRRPETTS